MAGKRKASPRKSKSAAQARKAAQAAEEEKILNQNVEIVSEAAADKAAAAEPENQQAGSQTEEQPSGMQTEAQVNEEVLIDEEDLARQLGEAERALADVKDKYLRLAAEYDNYRKRTQKEREILYVSAMADTAEKFLSVYDNLERALNQQTEDTAYYKGVEMIQTGLLSVLEKLNICPIEARGQPFDPSLHEAVMHITDDSGEENMVDDVLQVGFVLGDRVIRPSLVKVKN